MCEALVMNTPSPANRTGALTVTKKIAPILSAQVDSLTARDLERILVAGGVDVRDVHLRERADYPPDICAWEGRDSYDRPVRGALALRLGCDRGQVRFIAEIYLRDGGITRTVDRKTRRPASDFGPRTS